MTMRTVGRVLRNPGKYAMQPFCRMFAGGPFYLQGQMDVNERSRWFNAEFVARYGGYFLPSEKIERRVVDLEPWDAVRRDMLILLLRSLNERGVAGDMAELGVFKGFTAKLIHHYMPERRLHLFDTFNGFDQKDAERERRETGLVVTTRDFSDTDIRSVRAYIGAANGNVKIHAGFFPASVPAEVEPSRFCFVHLDADLYEPILAGLRFFYPRLNAGGILVIHDYNAWPGARKAVEEFFADKPEVPLPMPDKSGSAVVVRGAGDA